MTTDASTLNEVIAMLVFLGGGCGIFLLLLFGIGLLNRLGRRPPKGKLLTQEDIAALLSRMAAVEGQASELTTLAERVDFLEQLLETPARWPTLRASADIERAYGVAELGPDQL